MELIFPIHCQNTKFGETIFAIYVLQVNLARTISHVDVLHILLQEIWLAELFPKFKTLKKMEFWETVYYGAQKITCFCYDFCILYSI